jgi:ribosomal protein L29
MKRRDLLSDIRGLSTEKLSGKIAESQKKLVLLQQDKLLGKLKNVRELSVLKTDIARMKTVLDEKITEGLSK